MVKYSIPIEEMERFEGTNLMVSQDQDGVVSEYIGSLKDIYFNAMVRIVFFNFTIKQEIKL